MHALTSIVLLIDIRYRFSRGCLNSYSYGVHVPPVLQCLWGVTLFLPVERKLRNYATETSI